VIPKAAPAMSKARKGNKTWDDIFITTSPKWFLWLKKEAHSAKNINLNTKKMQTRTAMKLHNLEFNILQVLNRILLQQKEQCEPYKTLLCLNVSGGMDSMCLLNCLFKVTQSKHYPGHFQTRLVVFHFNHEMRGIESDRDEEFVIDYCLQHGIPVLTERRSEFGQYFQKQNNFQTQARNWRRQRSYDVCKQMSSIIQANNFYILMAHHMRDLAESLLQHILRGSGLEGLKGFLEFDNETKIMRPFVNFPYQDLKRYADVCKIPFRTDSSNESDDYERNYLRHHVLPHLEKLNPSYEDAFFRLSTNAQDFSRALEQAQGSKFRDKELFLTKQTTEGDIIRFAHAQNQSISRSMTTNVAKNIIAHFKKLSQTHASEINAVSYKLAITTEWSAIVDKRQLFFVRNSCALSKYVKIKEDEK
jgi:tRNA(Ile)-lysidine synthetase-like protein